MGDRIVPIVHTVVIAGIRGIADRQVELGDFDCWIGQHLLADRTA